ncbi:hypothetical protein JOM56_005408 [Amanita muscaria]
MSESMAQHMPEVSEDEGEDNSNVMEMTRTELIKALKSAQLQLSALRVENHQLKNQLDALQVAEGPTNSQKRTRKKPLPAAIERYKDEIFMRSKKFGVMNELFIPPDTTIFQQPRPAMDIYDTRLRYRSADLKIKGYVGEVYSEMPGHLHDLILKHSAFSETFRAAQKANKSHIISQLHKAAPIIWQDVLAAGGISNAVFSAKYDRSTVPEFQRLLCDKNGKYDLWSLLLFPNHTHKMAEAFMARELAIVLRVILFGLSATSDSKRRTAGPKPLGVIWGVQQVTPGAIATAAVLARFLFSQDTEFGAKGQQSKIDYESDFNEYKRYLIQKSDHPVVIKLFAFFNQMVFNPDSSESSASVLSVSSNTREDRLASAFEELDISECDGDPGDGNHLADTNIDEGSLQETDNDDDNGASDPRNIIYDDDHETLSSISSRIRHSDAQQPQAVVPPFPMHNVPDITDNSPTLGQLSLSTAVQALPIDSHQSVRSHSTSQDSQLSSACKSGKAPCIVNEAATVTVGETALPPPPRPTKRKGRLPAATASEERSERPARLTRSSRK